MKKLILYFSFFSMLLIGIMLRSEALSNSVSFSEDEYSTTNYQYLATRLNDIIAQVTPPQQIESALQAVFDANSPESASQTNRIEVRANMASVVFTNLALLEISLRRTAVVTNIVVLPVDGNEYLDESKVTDPTQRQQLLACRAALMAHGKLWNLNQALLAEYNRHWDRAINLLVSAYSLQPAADVELKKLFESYAGYDCMLQFSNQIYSIKK